MYMCRCSRSTASRCSRSIAREAWTWWSCTSPAPAPPPHSAARRRRSSAKLPPSQPAPASPCARKPRGSGAWSAAYWAHAIPAVRCSSSALSAWPLASRARRNAAAQSKRYERPQIRESRFIVMWTDGSLAAQMPASLSASPGLPLAASMPVSASPLHCVEVACGKPSGTYSASPGESVTSNTGCPSSSWHMTLPSLPWRSGSALPTSSGAKTDQRFLPEVWSTRTSCLSVCAGTETSKPGAER
mmetsp:Transcript_30857/g.98439  ORF Transcript_30857/g.98439 Transcript_30857/m.98439 type:complete len:244 (+) Transcript_30857:275-1006(+)